MRGRPGPSWKIHVHTTPEAAYAYVADFNKHPQWSFAADQMKIEGPERAEVGSVYKASGKLLNRDNPSTVTVTELEPSRRIEFEAEDAGGPISGHVFTFEKDGDGTLITRQMYGVKQPWYGPILFLLAKGAIDKDYNGALANLKAKLEAKPAAAGPVT